MPILTIDAHSLRIDWLDAEPTRDHTVFPPMLIFGVALLCSCLVVGMFIGEWLGILLGVSANIGGVGIAMLLLVLASNSHRLRSLTEGSAAQGIQFWSAMYIPIVVAMAARQNVVGATEGGLLALAAGTGAVVVSFALVPLLSRLGRRPPPDPERLP